MKTLLRLIIVSIVVLSGCNKDKLSEATVTIKDGVIKGTIENSIVVFRGIPFAAPPVGDLRWKEPQPVKPWKEVLIADKFAPAPVQPRVPWMSNINMSEDCLYLNVWTPAHSSKDKLPVMVWIYGVGFANGATSVPLYNGENIAKNGVF